MFIFIFAGIMSYKFGLTSPAAIFSLVFGLVLLFDVSFGLIPNVNGYPLATILVGLLLIGLIFREVT